MRALATKKPGVHIRVFTLDVVPPHPIRSRDKQVADEG